MRQWLGLVALGFAVLLSSNSAFAQVAAPSVPPKVAVTPSAPPSRDVVVAFGARDAHAQVAPARSAEVASQGEGKRWYGWQTLLIDAGSGGTLALGLAMSEGGRDLPPLSLLLVPGGTGGLVLGAPIAHVLHGRLGAGTLSLGLRIGLPLVGFGAAKLASGSEDAQLGALALGMATASAIDAALLAWEPRGETKRFSLSPTAAWDGARGGSVGVVGVF